jgi:hypothetical protein
LRPGTLSYYIEISKYPKEGGGTLGLGSRPQNLLKREDLGTLRPGDLECCLIISRSQNIRKREGGRWDMEAVLLYRGPEISENTEGGRWDLERCLIISRSQNVRTRQGTLWDLERCLIVSRSQNLRKRRGKHWNLERCLMVSRSTKSPKEAGKTLRAGTLSYYIEVPKSTKEGSRILGPGTVAPRNGGRSGTGRKRRSSGDGDGREAPTTLRPLSSSLPPFLLAQSYADLIAKLLLHLRDLDQSPVAGKAIAKDLPRRLEIREQQQ